MGHPWNPALGKLRQKDYYKFEASLDCIVTGYSMLWDSRIIINQNNNKNKSAIVRSSFDHRDNKQNNSNRKPNQPTNNQPIKNPNMLIVLEKDVLLSLSTCGG